MEADDRVAEKNYVLISPEILQIPRFTPKINLGVMASGNGTNFEALVNSTKNACLDAEIRLLIVNSHKCEAINRSKRLGIPYLILDHKEFNSRSEFDKEIIKQFSIYNIEGIVMAGWMRIVSPTLINAYPNRLINIHPSLLPSFRGANAIDKALNSNVFITGCSVHLVTPEVDNGPILIQAAVPIFKSDDKQTLLERIQIQEHRILPIGVSIAAEAWRDESSQG